MTRKPNKKKPARHSSGWSRFIKREVWGDQQPEFKQGLAAVELRKKWGYVNRAGKVKIPAQYDWASAFKGGVARVRTGWNDKAKYGLINLKGQVLLQPQYEDLGELYEGMMAATQGGKVGFIDRQGQLRIPLIFDEVEEFCEGFSAVRQGKKWGFVDKTGRWVLEPRYNDVGCFSEGLAAVKIGRLWGYINSSGKIVIKPRFKEADRFRKGRAMVNHKLHAYCPLINRSGKIVGKDWWD